MDEYRKRIDEFTLEVNLLRNVYEDARSVLRYDGVDKQKVIDALNSIGESIEQVKLLDSGYYEFGDD